MEPEFNTFLDFATLIKRFTAGYAGVLVEILERCHSYGQCALAVRDYLDAVLDRLRENTLLEQLTITGVGCDFHLPAYNRPVTFFSSLCSREPTRLVMREDTFFGQRWYYTTERNFTRTISFAFDLDTGDLFSFKYEGVVRAAPSSTLLSVSQTITPKSELSYGGTPFFDFVIRNSKSVTTTTLVTRALVSQAMAHKAMRLPLNFVCYVGSEHDLLSDPVVEFALDQVPSREQHMILKVLGQELVDQLSYVSGALRNRASAHLYPVVSAAMAHTHDLRTALDEFIDHVKEKDRSSSPHEPDPELQQLHSKMWALVNGIDNEILREIHATYELDADDIGSALRHLMTKQEHEVFIETSGDIRIAAPLSADSFAQLLSPFIHNAIAASNSSPASGERHAMLKALGALSHPCTVRITTKEQLRAMLGRYWFEWTGRRYVSRRFLEGEALLQVDIFDRGPGIPSDVLGALMTGTVRQKLPSTHVAGGRGIANTLLYLRSIANAEYSYRGFWTIKLRAFSAKKQESVYGVAFRSAKEVFSRLR